jgi:hypothetical protein
MLWSLESISRANTAFQRTLSLTIHRPAPPSLKTSSTRLRSKGAKFEEQQYEMSMFTVAPDGTTFRSKKLGRSINLPLVLFLNQKGSAEMTTFTSRVLELDGLCVQDRTPQQMVLGADNTLLRLIVRDYDLWHHTVKHIILQRLPHTDSGSPTLKVHVHKELFAC